MFAYLLTDNMDGFYAIITSFPTVVFTVLLLVSLFYWLISMFGVIDFDILDVGGDSGDSGHGVNGIAGLVMKLGLNGVPIPIVVSLISGIGWFVSYYTVYFLYPFVPSFLELPIDLVILLSVFYLSVMLTAQIIKPLRRFFLTADQQVEKNIIGKVAVIRTGRVDHGFGEATVEDGGAGLIVKVRPYKKETFSRGDRVVLLEYIASENVYKIISESDFSS